MLFGPFSAGEPDYGIFRVFQTLKRETENYTRELDFLVEGRLSKLRTGLRDKDLREKIKLPEADLKLTIASTAKMLEHMYPSRVLRNRKEKEMDFWKNQQLRYKDWKGLACKILSNIFSPSFLTPLEDTDMHFQLKIKHMSILKYGEMLNSAEFHDDLDLIVATLRPNKKSIDLKYPSLDRSYFDPQPQNLYPRKYYNDHSEHSFCSLEVPVPILHPVDIAIYIYNRENDQCPINMDSLDYNAAVKRAKKEPFINFSDLSSMGPSQSHTEISSPDNMPTEPMTMISHLALQERSFSETML